MVAEEKSLPTSIVRMARASLGLGLAAVACAFFGFVYYRYNPIVLGMFLCAPLAIVTGWIARVRLGDRRTTFRRTSLAANGGIAFGLLCSLSLLLIPASDYIRDSIDRFHSAKNFRQLITAMFNYEGSRGHLPPAAIYSEDGKALLSWRVELLPFIEANDLFERFKLDEPWDSTHNLALLKEMPRLYAPVGDYGTEPYTTYYQVFVGPGTLFEPGKTVRIDEVAAGDGFSNTILIAEAAQAVPWTKPDELFFAPDRPLHKLGYLRKRRGWFDSSRTEVSGAHVALGLDIRFLRPDIDEDLLRRLITWRDGLPVPSDF